DKILDKSLQKIIFLLSTMPFSGKLINTLDKDLIIRSTTLVLHPSVSFSKLSLDSNELIQFWFSNETIQSYLKVHEIEGITWFNKESFEFLVELSLGILYLKSNLADNTSKISALDSHISEIRTKIKIALKKSDYQVNLFKSAILDDLHQYPNNL
ncbi:MAG: hypothetical protein MUO54_11095, partial [Anaerolineales bacterium]|nr:hypothetical protein [Anaerolineales bacterium]